MERYTGGPASGRGAGAGRLTAVVPSGAARVLRADGFPAAERLAERLAGADGAAAEALFTAAFGLYGARHLGGVLPEGADGEPGCSWWHGPTVHQPAALRGREGGRRSRVAPGRDALAATGRRGRHRKPVPGSPEQVAVERRTAARLLAAHPLVTADGPHGEGLPLIHRHADWLVERFATLLGYPLTVGAGYARLHKAPLPGRTPAPAEADGWTPQGYAALVRALVAVAEGREPRSIGPESAGPGPVEPRLADHGAADHGAAEPRTADRGTAVPGCAGAAETGPTVRQRLAEWRVLTPGQPGDREVAAALLAPGPGEGPVSDEVAVRRLLAETPVVLLDELTPGQRRWLLAHRADEAALFADFLGLAAECRAEGIALLDPADELTDLALPGTGTLAQAALLLAARLVEELRPLPEESAPPAVLVPDALIDGALGDITDEHGLRNGWRRDYLADLTAFRRDALDLLHRMQLIAPAGRAWLLRAPAARYAPAVEPEPPAPGRHSRAYAG
ncbi:DUF2398 family protein [Kitasatospora sp. NPDC096147]|uniref:DUF2398 family protein n=1 Tax=Kitasatospora sp. NPDC096147 TaxID=3364093 RepID=UPI003814DD2F